MPRAFSAAISPASSARIALPTAVPSMMVALVCNVHRPGLPNDHDPDLPGILQLRLDLARDLVGQLAGLEIVHHVRRDHDPHLSPRLDSENLLDARELASDALRSGHALGVGSVRSTASRWSYI